MKDIGIFVINLKESTDRLRQVWPLLSKLNLPLFRVEAIHGGKLDSLESLVDQRKHQRYFGKTMGRGTAGCALSHSKAWDVFLQSPYQFAVICEDDIDFDLVELESVLSCLMRDKEVWDICGLQLNHRGCPLTIKKYSSHHLVSYLFPVTGGGCYILNRRAAQILKTNAHPIMWPVDHYYTRPWGMNLVFVGVEPRPVFQRPGKSEIDSISRHHQEKLSLRGSLIRVWYVIQKSLGTVGYGFKTWMHSYIRIKMRGRRAG